MTSLDDTLTINTFKVLRDPFCVVNGADLCPWFRLGPVEDSAGVAVGGVAAKYEGLSDGRTVHLWYRHHWEREREEG